MKKITTFICLFAAFCARTTGAVEDYGEMEEVIVEAQRRSQGLNEVPLAISVLDADLLSANRLYRIQTMAPVVPGLSGWEQGASTPIYAIRGISSNSFGIGGESSVALFVDETYRGRINSTSITLVDIENVEVLKGPQGTLFGRNASAGAILINHRRPQETQSLDIAVGAGDNSWHSVEATLNLPLGKDWGFRGSGFYSNDNGYTDNTWLQEDVGDRRTRGAQGILAYGGGDIDLRLRASSQRTDTGGLGYETLDPELAAAGGVNPDPFDSVLATDIDTYDDVESHDISLQVDWQLLDNLQLHSISAWHKNDSPNLFDVDGSAVFLTSAGFTHRQSETWSQELRLHGSHNAWDWVAGTLLFQEDIETRIELGYSDDNLLAGTLLCSPAFAPALGECQASVTEVSLQDGDYSSLGLFADASWQMNEEWSLGLGLRYSYDDKDFRYNAPGVASVITRLNASALNPSGNLLGYATDGQEKLSEDWDGWQPRVSLNWEFRPGHNSFINLARGYKAGGFEPAATPQLSIYNPEKVWNLDLGLRGQWAGWNTRYQLNAFAYDYDDYQVQLIANGLARTGNVDGVDGRGLELELDMQPREDLQLRVTGAWLDAQFDTFLSDGADLSGNSPILSPEYSASLSASWRSSLQAWGALGLNWLSSYQSRVYFTVQNTADARQSTFYRHDVVFNYFAPSERWQLDAFVRNLLDEEYRIFERDVGAGPVSRRGEPRVWGVMLRARF